MNQPKYVLIENNKAASEPSEAAFILCTRNPKFIAEIKTFRTLSTMDDYVPTNQFIQVRKNLPIILEVTEIEDDFSEKELANALKYMAKWYFYNHLTK